MTPNRSPNELSTFGKDEMDDAEKTFTQLHRLSWGILGDGVWMVCNSITIDKMWTLTSMEISFAIKYWRWFSLVSSFLSKALRTTRLLLTFNGWRGKQSHWTYVLFNCKGHIAQRNLTWTVFWGQKH